MNSTKKRKAAFGYGFLAIILLALALPGLAVATSGTLNLTASTTLTEDHSGNISIDADNVTLDCAGRTVFGPGNGALNGLIQISARNWVTVRNCTVSGSNVNGIYATQSPNLRLENNTLFRNANHGVPVANTDGFFVIGNRSHLNGALGFEALGFVLTGSSRGLIENNIAENNRNWSGFGLFEASNQNTLISNTANGNANIGFYLGSSHDNQLVGNVATHNVFDGITLEFASSNNRFFGNTSDRNGQSGVILFGPRDGNIFVRNQSNRNVNGGCTADGANHNTFLMNRAMQNNEEGFGLRAGASYNIVNGNLAQANSVDGYDDGTGTGNVWKDNDFRTTSGF